MARFLYLFIVLILLGHSLEAQNRRYSINTSNTEITTGSVTITDQYIYIFQDSVVTTLPIVASVLHKRTTYYILEGCYKGKAFKGAGMFTESSTQKMGEGHYRRYFALYIEIRARQEYSATKYSIFYDE